MEQAQHVQVALEHIAALDGEERADAARGCRALQVLGAAHLLQVLAMHVEHRVERVDLAQAHVQHEPNSSGSLV